MPDWLVSEESGLTLGQMNLHSGLQAGPSVKHEFQFSVRSDFERGYLTNHSDSEAHLLYGKRAYMN